MLSQRNDMFLAEIYYYTIYSYFDWRDINYYIHLENDKCL